MNDLGVMLIKSCAWCMCVIVAFVLIKSVLVACGVLML